LMVPQKESLYFLKNLFCALSWILISILDTKKTDLFLRIKSVYSYTYFENKYF
jgi:hypothetical protein